MHIQSDCNLYNNIYIYIYIQASSQLNITGSQLFSDSIHAVAHDTFYHKRFPF